MLGAIESWISHIPRIKIASQPVGKILWHNLGWGFSQKPTVLGHPRDPSSKHGMFRANPFIDADFCSRQTDRHTDRHTNRDPVHYSKIMVTGAKYETQMSTCLGM